MFTIWALHLRNYKFHIIFCNHPEIFNNIFIHQSTHTTYITSTKVYFYKPTKKITLGFEFHTKIWSQITTNLLTNLGILSNFRRFWFKFLDLTISDKYCNYFYFSSIIFSIESYLFNFELYIQYGSTINLAHLDIIHILTISNRWCRNHPDSTI